MTKPLTLIVFLGGLGYTPVEQTVAAARRAAALDTIETALSSGAFDRAILATDDPSLESEEPGFGVDIDDGPFHFGFRLAGIVSRHALHSIVYLGAGSVPLFASDDFAALATAMEARPDAIITNNAFSSDLVAFTVSDGVVEAIAEVDRDNGLARALEEGAGLQLEELPRTVPTQFDIDTPSDLAILALTGGGGTRLQEHFSALGLDLSPYARVLPLFTNKEAQIVVAGRVGSHAWQYLERETACRVRLFAEERGLEAEGRAAGARSLIGFFIEAEGIDRFFEVLSQLGDAAFIDTRVLLAHFRIEATRADRFLSDLGAWREIRDPFLRDFTRAAAGARIPVLLGGHSLMSGGLMALNEYAWRQHEAQSP